MLTLSNADEASIVTINTSELFQAIITLAFLQKIINNIKNRLITVLFSKENLGK